MNAELVLNYILEFLNTPVAITSGITLTAGSIIVMLIKFFVPKNKQLRATEILIDDQRIENKYLKEQNNLQREEILLLREENAYYKESINTIAKRSRNKEIKALAIEEETPVQEETEMIKVKVVE